MVIARLTAAVPRISSRTGTSSAICSPAAYTVPYGSGSHKSPGSSLLPQIDAVVASPPRASAASPRRSSPRVRRLSLPVDRRAPAASFGPWPPPARASRRRRGRRLPLLLHLLVSWRRRRCRASRNGLGKQYHPVSLFFLKKIPLQHCHASDSLP
jgi:hypothetical protein